MRYVYILECHESHPYTGCTHDLKERVIRHEKGYIPATRNRLPVMLFAYFAFKDKYTGLILKNISNPDRSGRF